MAVTSRDGQRRRVEAVVDSLRARFVGHVPLARVARHSGLPVGTLRRILSGEQEMTLLQFLALAAAAERPEMELLGPAKAAVEAGVTTYAEADSAWRFVDRDAVVPAPLEQRITGPERAARRHDGVEWIYVVKGAVTMLVGTPFRAVGLQAGESMTIDASAPHLIAEVSGTSATLVRWMTAGGIRAHIPVEGGSSRFG